jgi:hypothetical protein
MLLSNDQTFKNLNTLFTTFSNLLVDADDLSDFQRCFVSYNHILF